MIYNHGWNKAGRRWGVKVETFVSYIKAENCSKTCVLPIFLVRSLDVVAQAKKLPRLIANLHVRPHTRLLERPKRREPSVDMNVGISLQPDNVYYIALDEM